MKKLAFLLLTFIFFNQAVAQKMPDFLKDTTQLWVETQFAQLSPKERIAQLLMVAAYSHADSAHRTADLVKLIKEYKIGGIIFFRGEPIQQALLTNQFQALSKTPLLISIDAEWGLGMRLKNTIKFPYQMTLGAIRDEQLIYQMGAEIARQSKRMGIHVNFAPVVDVNNNPNNPVISFRSFGEGQENVLDKGLAYMNGMQENGLLATIKHFPGHGDTDVDSHLGLPLLNFDRERLTRLELYPFQELINEGASSVMVAHMSIPALDSTKNLPSTLSKPIVTDLLKKEMGFQGLTFTDALNMKGVTKFFPPGEVDVRALLAGNDALLFTEDVPKAIAEIEQAVRTGQITQEEIDRRCKKLLAVKYWAKLHEWTAIDTTQLIPDLNSSQAKWLNRQLMEASLTLLKNDNDVMPIKQLHYKKIASLSIGRDTISDFQTTLGKYTHIDHYWLSKNDSAAAIDSIKMKLKDYDVVIVGLHQMRYVPFNRLVYNDAMRLFISDLATSHKSIFAWFRNPYTLAKIDYIEKVQGLILTYQDNQDAEELAAQVIFGGIGANGKLPVTIDGKFNAGYGLNLTGGERLKFTLPEELGIATNQLHFKIDSVVNLALQEGVAPGIQVLAAKDGKVFFHKNYGYHTYDSVRKVRLDDIYDIASITKIIGPLPALMKLYDERKLKLNMPLSKYWSDWQSGNKKRLKVREVLAHQARLKAWIPYWQAAVKKNGSFKKNTFAKDSSEIYSIRVTDSLFLHKDYHYKIDKAIRKSKLRKEEGYRYSGLSFYVYPRMIESLTGDEYEYHLKEHFYKPLGASTFTFNAYKHYPLARIIPTEVDTFFRKTLLHGYVHDEGAAMMGGVSGNAGLFSSTIDLAKMMQMYLWMGQYGGERYISEATVKEFTKRHYAHKNNRRGLGFDKPLLKDKEKGTPALAASEASFGHSGYTGTFTWADPENGLLFIFMSNRVHPTRTNGKIYELNIRPALHNALYELLGAQK
ncbi:MAG: glycoside hydrolase family 3 N-terminal domain-containing protein [Flammeovirgaceae bacterium]